MTGGHFLPTVTQSPADRPSCASSTMGMGDRGHFLYTRHQENSKTPLGISGIAPCQVINRTSTEPLVPSCFLCLSKSVVTVFP